MEDWHIVTLVLMIVVFLIVLAIYTYAWFNTKKMVGQRVSAAHLIYYEHLGTGRVNSLDLNVLVATQQQQSAAAAAPVTNPDGTLQQEPPPVIQQASELTKDAIIRALAIDCGIASPSDLAKYCLNRKDERINTTIALEEDAFFDPLVRASNIASTAMYPLCFRPAEHWQRKYNAEETDELDVVPVPVIFAQNEADGGVITTDTPVYINAVGYPRVSSDENMSLLSIPSKQRMGISRDQVPTGWVQALEQQYYAERQRPPPPAYQNGGVGAAAGSIVYVDLGDGIHEGRMNVSSGRVDVFQKSRLQPQQLQQQQPPQAQDQQQQQLLMTLKRTEAPVLRYCYENSDAAWFMYCEPLHLPVGRWCVRAEANTHDRRIIHSSARVFTVQNMNGHTPQQESVVNHSSSASHVQ